MLIESPLIKAKIQIREFKQRHNIPLILPPISNELSKSSSPTNQIHSNFKPYIKERDGLNKIIDVIPIFSLIYHIGKEIA